MTVALVNDNWFDLKLDPPILPIRVLKEWQKLCDTNQIQIVLLFGLVIGYNKITDFVMVNDVLPQINNIRLRNNRISARLIRLFPNPLLFCQCNINLTLT